MFRTTGFFVIFFAAIMAVAFGQTVQNPRYTDPQNPQYTGPQYPGDVRDIRFQIASIDRNATRLGRFEDPYIVLSNQIGVPVDTLREQREDMNLTFGQLTAAHAIARASGRNFESIARQFQNGDTWRDIVMDSGANVRDVNRQLRTINSDLRYELTHPHRH